MLVVGVYVEDLDTLVLFFTGIEDIGYEAHMMVNR